VHRAKAHRPVLIALYIQRSSIFVIATGGTRGI
jgi:hypothetical protein